MADDKINPIGLLYEDFEEILNNITIKYFIKAEEYETLETQQNADMYLDVVKGKDNFYSYIDYTSTEYQEAGWTDTETINIVINTGNTELVPEIYRDGVLELRRKRVLRDFEEGNNYYRMLNGYPDLDDTEYFYASEALVKEYGLPADIPIHKIQDYCNNIIDGQGDYYISIANGTGYVDKLIEAHPDKTYLKYLGSNRISILTARTALNFQCIQLKNSGEIKEAVYNEFLDRYDQCREYFVKTVYMKEYREFLDYYDNFIAMCIMLMTVQQMNVGQLMSGVHRSFFSIYGVRALYKAYNVPFNLNIDESTQNQLVQNLNLLVQDKATNEVIYNLAYLLGFTNISIYKYYLGKERKFDLYGAPIVAYKEKFNTDTGEVEIVPDYETMYDLYFQKEELRNNDLAKTFNNNTNSVPYNEIVDKDAFWWQDDKLYQRVWETQYNFVESKYLGVGISYSLTDILFENVLLLKMLMSKHDITSTIYVELPRITGSESIPVFDIVIFLICLTASKHNLTGEIITIPTQVISVIDYMRNVEETDMLIDTLNFNFAYFDPENQEARKDMMDLKAELGDEAYEKFMAWVDDIAYSEYDSKSTRVTKLNSIFEDAKNMYKFLRYHMTYTTSRRTYTLLKNMENAIYYSKEMRDIFTITGAYTEEKRTAWTYFEFLYHLNPILYNSFFEIDYNTLWKEYLEEHGLKPSDFTLEEYLIQIELGNIKVDYDTIKSDYINTKDETIYYFVNHVIDRLSHVVKTLNMIYLINNTSTALSDLLCKLIKFFKSYTVDLITMDTMLILDLKPGSTVKLLDEFNKIIKEMQQDDAIRLSHSDLVHFIKVQMEIEDRLTLSEKLLYTAILTLDEKDLTIIYDDMISKVKTNQVNEEDLKKLFDIVRIESNLDINEKMSLRDTVTVIKDDQ